jgi:hypothetical protein
MAQHPTCGTSEGAELAPSVVDEKSAPGCQGCALVQDGQRDTPIMYAGAARNQGRSTTLAEEHIDRAPGQHESGLERN